MARETAARHRARCPRSSEDRNPVERLAEEFLERDRRGERPSLTEYVARYPHLAGDIRELFPLLLEMEDVRPTAGETAGSTEEFRGKERGTPDPAVRRLPDPSRDRPRRHGDRLRGGARVAGPARGLQGPSDQHPLLDSRRLERFKREARAAARLHHTNIVPVFGVGEEGDCHYYVMQFIQGQGLDEVLRELRRLKGMRGKDERPGQRGSTR